MNRHERRAQRQVLRAIYKMFAHTIAEAGGFATELYKAAEKAAETGAAKDIAAFTALSDRLSPEEQAVYIPAFKAMRGRQEELMRKYLRAGALGP